MQQTVHLNVDMNVKVDFWVLCILRLAIVEFSCVEFMHINIWALSSCPGRGMRVEEQLCCYAYYKIYYYMIIYYQESIPRGNTGIHRRLLNDEDERPSNSVVS